MQTIAIYSLIYYSIFIALFFHFEFTIQYVGREQYANFLFGLVTMIIVVNPYDLEKFYKRGAKKVNSEHTKKRYNYLYL